MTLQNRVTPSGDIDAVAARGTMMGNRGGCFHRPDRTLKSRRWASKQWLCCVLSFKDRRRRVFSPGLYTELFFLDEATALAAGHRPCFECRRADAQAFAAAWGAVHSLASPPRAPGMDSVLHAERLASAPRLDRARSRLSILPDGVFVRIATGPALVRAGALHAWTHDGYSAAGVADPSLDYEVITPPAIVAVISAGYRPSVHSSAG